MKKKIYILALTFLCLLCSQMSFGQGINEGGGDDWDNSECTYGRTELVESHECYDIFLTIIETYYCDSAIHIGTYWYTTYEYKECGGNGSGGGSGSAPDPCPSGDCNGSDNGSPDDPCPSGDYNDCYGNGGGGGSAPPPVPTEPPCTINCENGYILIKDNCECVKKPCDEAKVADHIYNTLNGIQEAGKTELNDYGNVHLVSPAGLPSVFNSPDFKWSDPVTGFNSALYSVDHGNGNIELIYATQGTNPLDLQDWVNNGQQALGYVSAQYTQSVNNAIVLATWAANNGYTLSFTGHSLGGGLANANALATGLPATIYNPAGLSDGTISNDPRLILSNSSNVTAYIVRGEPVDYLNTQLNTPVRGTKNYVGSPQDTNSLYGTLSNLTIAGLIGTVQLHLMSNVISYIDCNN